MTWAVPSRRATAPKRTSWPIGHAIGLALTGAVFGYVGWTFILKPVVRTTPKDFWLNLPAGTVVEIPMPVWPAILLTAAIGCVLARVIIRREGRQLPRTIFAAFFVGVASIAVAGMIQEFANAIYRDEGVLRTIKAALSGFAGGAGIAPLLIVHPPGILAFVLFGVLASQIGEWLD